MTITLTHRSPELYAAEMTGAEGALIDSLRDDCGYVIQGIDWVTRKVGFDLIGSIFDPIAGDFGTVDAMSASWASAGTALGDISENYAAMVTALPEAWEGPASSAALTHLSQVSDAHATQQEACTLISRQIQNMLEMTRTTCELIAECLSFVDEIVLSLTAAKILKEIATFGGNIRKIVSLVRRAIDFVQDLSKLIPALLKAAAGLAAVMKATNAVLKLSVVGTNYGAGNYVNETADAAW
ncbi:hypothetical protein G7072_12290 [Nocardioides sp. HDW12B]|uniref:WXG100 family type VII secretion target n=1 Tax=Nocardioides sp. HDW12B TaxID=2714939 RepID=UPI001409807F|nr:hypothetical protein [Nocardioides sp. HDW12B]QIK67018.1 hypothetical protein G7072_12290 [Nocardioides sp. HDW12B]